MPEIPHRRLHPEAAHPLARYLPEEALDVVLAWIKQYRVSITARPPLKHALGTYHPPTQQHSHRIYVNNDLNPYAFLITLVHEMAHLTCWLKHGDRVAPHGPEWKETYRQLMEAFRGRKIFTRRVTEVFRRHLLNPKFSHCCDPDLMRALAHYDQRQGVMVSQLTAGSSFWYEGRLYCVLRPLRRRVLCRQLQRNADYFFEPYVWVQPQAQGANVLT